MVVSLDLMILYSNMIWPKDRNGLNIKWQIVNPRYVVASRDEGRI